MKKMQITEAKFRPDIEGLRAIAVLMVIAFHAGLGRLGGGFIGVDVFFVLSGYLISGLLVREIEESGGLSLVRFYARRIRRLLPASLLMLVAIIVATRILFPPTD
jgi:peptidoglycan/LPS O-acetylase OafA/YrhL